MEPITHSQSAPRYLERTTLPKGYSSPTRHVSLSSSTARAPSLQSLRLTCMTAVLTWSTRSLPYTLVLVDDPRCQPPTVNHPTSPVPPSKPPTFVLHRSQSIVTDPLDLHLRRRPPSPSSTPAHHKPKGMLHNPTHAMVISTTQPKTRITLTITHHNQTTTAHINLVFTISPL